jgi:ligand-binding sensor domain-containing protein
MWVLDSVVPRLVEKMQLIRVKEPPPSKESQEMFSDISLGSWKRDPLNRFHTMFEGNDGVVWFVRYDELVSHDGRNWSARLRLPEYLERAYASKKLKFLDHFPKLLKEGRAKQRRFSSLTPNELEKRIPATAFSETYYGLQNRRGEIWLGADRGLVVFSQSTFEWNLYPVPAGLTQVRLLFEDRLGRMWIADLDGGVAVHDAATGSWTSYVLRDLFPEVCTYGVPVPKDFTVSGLSGKDIGYAGPKPNADGLVAQPSYWSSRVAAIYQDRDGRMMFGTRRGMIVYSESEKKWQIFTPGDSGLPGRDVSAIFEDRRGRIWVGTDQGIVVLEQ